MSTQLENFEASKSDKTIFATVHSSSGDISINKAGFVIENELDGEYSEINRFNLIEQANWWANKTGSMAEFDTSYDILDLGYWLKDGSYSQPEYSFRESITLSKIEYLENKIKAVLDYQKNELTLIFGYEIKGQDFVAKEVLTTKLNTDSEQWCYPHIGGHDLAVCIDHDEELMISIYTYTKPMEEIMGKALNFLDMSDSVELHSVETIGTPNWE